MTKNSRTSCELTTVTAPILEQLKLAGFTHREVLNAGIILFSQLDEDQKKIFRASAYGSNLEKSQRAREIFRKWFLEIVKEIEEHPEEIESNDKATSSGAA